MPAARNRSFPGHILCAGPLRRSSAVGNPGFIGTAPFRPGGRVCGGQKKRSEQQNVGAHIDGSVAWELGGQGEADCYGEFAAEAKAVCY